MFGSGMFTAMQKAKAGRAKVDSAEDKLEASRIVRSIEAKYDHPIGILADLQGPKHRVGMFPESAPKVFLERGAAAEKQALAEEAARGRDEAARAARAAAEARETYAALVAARDPSVASRWFYLDDDGDRRGPFEPGQMRGGFTDGHLPRELRVAPAFDVDGRVPGPADMRRIDELFKEPLLTSAFRVTPPPPSDLATVPAQEKKKKEKRKRDDDGPTGNWLQDSLRRQKQGIHARRHDRHDGPAMLYESHEA